MTLLVTARPGWRWRQHSILPGFKLSMALTLFWLSAIVIIPLIGLAVRPWEHGVQGVWAALGDERVLHALQLSFGAAALAALVNAPLGLLVAWVLVRYRFPGRRYIDALVDLPFALPTAVAGIALTTIYSPNGPLGAFFGQFGVKTAYTPVGIWIALLFVGLPFVVRSVQPVLQDLEIEVEEAATTLGANAFQRVTKVVLPAVYPALLTGVGLAFGRGVGEYGSVIFIAGNLPMISEIAPLLIVIKLEQYDYAGAAAVGLAMLVISFGALIVINAATTWLSHRAKA